MATFRRPSTSGGGADAAESQTTPPPLPLTPLQLPPLVPFGDGPFAVVFTFFSLVAYGLLQERVMSRTFDGERFAYAFYLVAANRLASVGAALSLHALRAVRAALLPLPPASTLAHQSSSLAAAAASAAAASAASASAYAPLSPSSRAHHRLSTSGGSGQLGGGGGAGTAAAAAATPRAAAGGGSGSGSRGGAGGSLLRRRAARLSALLALPPPAAPLRCYAAVALSNAAATACQYESLRHVSFICASLAKTAKALPVLLWGLVRTASTRRGGAGAATGRTRRHTAREWAQAALLSCGCALFVVGGGSAGRGVLSEARAAAAAAAAAAGGGSSSSGSSTSGGGGPLGLVAGALLLAGYLAADGWTSTEQERLYSAYGMDEGDQLLHTSACSALLSCGAAVLSGQLWPASAFLRRHPDAALAVFGLSAASAATQVCISAVVRRHGALVFALMMTTRQLASVLLSALVFGHALAPLQWAGVAVAFAALMHRGARAGGGGAGGGGSRGRGGGGGAGVFALASAATKPGAATAATARPATAPSSSSPFAKGAPEGDGESDALMQQQHEHEQQQLQQQHNKGAGSGATLLPITARAS
jgi:solute carrier family 35 (adenosine 3'-phospho 5'-phosphosulfate transporter), member B2